MVNLAGKIYKMVTWKVRYKTPDFVMLFQESYGEVRVLACEYGRAPDLGFLGFTSQVEANSALLKICSYETWRGFQIKEMWEHIQASVPQWAFRYFTHETHRPSDTYHRNGMAALYDETTCPYCGARSDSFEYEWEGWSEFTIESDWDRCPCGACWDYERWYPSRDAML